MQVSAQQQPSPLTNVVRVVAVKGGDMAGTWEFKKDTITVGRSPEADVRLDSKDISRVHCTLQIRPDGIFVIDGQSLNGTRINGTRISEQSLTPRDLVQIGAFRFKAFLVARADDDASEKTPAEDGPRVQLAAVPSPESGKGTDPTAPAIKIPVVAKKKGFDPLPAHVELIDPPEQETPDPLPPHVELVDSEIEEQIEPVEKTPLHPPAFASAPAAALADRVSEKTNSQIVDPAPVAQKKLKMARGNMLALAFFTGSAIFFVASFGAAALIWVMVF